MLRSPSSFAAVLVAISGPAAAASSAAGQQPESYPDWRDLPIGCETITMLDGSDWTVTGRGRSFSTKCTGGATAGADGGCCNFEEGVDYSAGRNDKVTGVAYAMDQDRCCETCAATAGCAAAVWRSAPSPPRPPPAPPAPPSSDCSFATNVDFHPETVLGSRPAKTPEECCGICRATTACLAAVLDGGTCYMKAKKDVAGGNYSRSGRVACLPKANASHSETSSAATTSLAEMSPSQAGAAQLRQQAAAGGACYMKTTADLASKKTGVKGSTACIPASATALPTFTINATVPGELLTDLQNAGKIGDPLSSNNHKDPLQVQWWNGDVYTYTKNFVHSAPAQERTVLVFDGIKLGASISLNGHLLGNTTNQHRRYIFDVSNALKDGGNNKLTVRFDRAIPNGGRFMACSGGWDCPSYIFHIRSMSSSVNFPVDVGAPYSRIRDIEGNPMLTRGIWKSVYLAGSAATSAQIESFTPTVFHVGPVPTSVLPDDGSASFTVNCTAHLSCGHANDIAGTIDFTGDWPDAKPVAAHTKCSGGSVVVSAMLTAKGVKLWWPRGMGSQPLYNVSATFTPTMAEGAQAAVRRSGKSVATTRRIGFRTATLTTGNDTDPAWVAAHAHTNGNAVPAHTVMVRINGAAVSARGANMIPMETLEGRYVKGMHRALVKSAADANMNFLRIWGGGVYIYEEFTNACDEYGVMVYEDMMYGTDGIMPGASNTDDQEAELRYQIRRQAHHPAIVGWSGCNECGGHGVYTDFVMTTVASEDQSRLIRSSSPFGSYSSGVHTLTGLPNGQRLVDIPLQSEKSSSPWPGGAEQHGPYQHGGIFPAINGGGKMISNPPLVIGVQPGSAVGPAEPGYMKTETGCSVLQSFESLSATLKSNEYGIHTDPFHERNYPGDPLVLSYFGPKRDLDRVGEDALKEVTYLNMLAAGLQRKANIESWRSTNIWAMLMWQLNEIWPTGGWGSLEYGTPVAGQVLGGRWKPLHHFMQQSAYTDVSAACGHAAVTMMDASDDASGPALCYIRNDLPKPFAGIATVSILHFDSGASTVLNTVRVALPAGGGAVDFFCAARNSTEHDTTGAGSSSCPAFEDIFKNAGCGAGAADCMLNVTVTDAGGSPVSRNMLPLTLPASMKLPPADVTHTIKEAATASNEVQITLMADKTALFVWLTTAEHGRFSDNAFVLRPGEPVTVSFISFLPEGSSSSALERSLRIEHLAMYCSRTAGMPCH